mmetsp:Transcript_1165/g.3731  ORF Transcript_1165/g.3731 Transcript_1165/m.3731 type:complete len:241 (+) Transcript_1165:2292-3014(+)
MLYFFSASATGSTSSSSESSVGTSAGSAGAAEATFFSTCPWIEASHVALICSISCMWRGKSFSKTATGHFSSASGITVWLVYARDFFVISQALLNSSPWTSIKSLISSGTAMVGWVSFIWKQAFSGSFSRSLCFSKKRARVSWSEAATKKYCCFKRSSFPSSVASLGYRTATISSAFLLLRTALSYSPALNASRSNSSMGSQSHSLRFDVVVVRYPGIGTSQATASTFSAGVHVPLLTDP